MEFDLRDHLRDLSAAPSVPAEAVPTTPVLARIRRGRARRATAVATVSAAAVLAIGAVVYAAPWRVPPPPPADTPEPTATSEPAPTPTPTETPEPTEEPPTATPAPYAITSGGDLIELDPETGAVVRTVASSPDWTESLSLTPDRRYAYVGAMSYSDEGADWPGEIQRVSLADGAVETVLTSANDPAVSPDGTRLAYLAYAPGDARATERSLTVMDLRTGTVTASIQDEQCVECERIVTTPTWLPDGRLVIGLGWTDGYPGVAQFLVDPATTATLGAATLLGPDNSGDLQGDWFGRTALAADGTLLVPAEEGSADQWDARYAYDRDGGPGSNQPTGLLVVVDRGTGSVLDRIPVDGMPTSVAAEPDGEAALVVVWPTTGSDVPSVLQRWDGTTLTPVGEGYETVAW